MKTTIKQKIEDLGIHAIGSFILKNSNTGDGRWYIVWGHRSSEVHQYLNVIIDEHFTNPNGDDDFDEIHPDINCGCTHTLSITMLKQYYDILINIGDKLPVEDNIIYYIEFSPDGITLLSKTKKEKGHVFSMFNSNEIN